jgi:hypothetical protein
MRVSGHPCETWVKAVLEWYDLHLEELLVGWKLAAEGKLPNKIEPLE